MSNTKLVPLLLAAIPFSMLTIAVPFVNHIEPFIWGMPFFLAWLFINVLLTPVWLGLAYLYEKKQRRLRLENKQKI